MARLVRTWFQGAKFHVTSRAIRRSPLFLDDKDYEKYLEFLEETMEMHPFVLHSYCLMTTHTHLQIETQATPLSVIMKHFNTKYAKYFNKKYDYSGHVFEKRYGAELLNSPEYEVDVSKYIHLNPVAAGMVSVAEDYHWSSYRAYIHGEKLPLVSPQHVLSFFPDPPSQCYQQYMQMTKMEKLFWQDGKLYILDGEEKSCGQR